MATPRAYRSPSITRLDWLALPPPFTKSVTRSIWTTKRSSHPSVATPLRSGLASITRRIRRGRRVIEANPERKGVATDGCELRLVVQIDRVTLFVKGGGNASQSRRVIEGDL